MGGGRGEGRGRRRRGCGPVGGVTGVFIFACVAHQPPEAEVRIHTSNNRANTNMATKLALAGMPLVVAAAGLARTPPMGCVLCRRRRGGSALACLRTSCLPAPAAASPPHHYPCAYASLHTLFISLCSWMSWEIFRYVVVNRTTDVGSAWVMTKRHLHCSVMHWRVRTL